jgi:hypothetical protein
MAGLDNRYFNRLRALAQRKPNRAEGARVAKLKWAQVMFGEKTHGTHSPWQLSENVRPLLQMMPILSEV